MRAPEVVSHSLALRSVSIFMLIVIVVIITTGVTLLATLLVMTLFATSLIAIVTALFTATIVPDRVSQNLQYLDRSMGVVALDHQLTAPRTFFGCFVTNNYAQTRTRAQRRREWVVN